MGRLDLEVFTQSLGLSGHLLSFVQNVVALKRVAPAAPGSASPGLSVTMRLSELGLEQSFRLMDSTHLGHFLREWCGSWLKLFSFHFALCYGLNICVSPKFIC